mmetsp:Transcript_68695/g.217156  ORF Transcript_68695/g.217156 Transcript_68695/m.217156 type:complete len:751 (+) Transcript_68695:86-2338(+)
MPVRNLGPWSASKEARGFDEALQSLAKDLQRLAELHRKELAMATKKVNTLSVDNNALSDEVARLEALLSPTSKMASQAGEVVEDAATSFPNSWPDKSAAKAPGYKANPSNGVAANVGMYSKDGSALGSEAEGEEEEVEEEEQSTSQGKTPPRGHQQDLDSEDAFHPSSRAGRRNHDTVRKSYQCSKLRSWWDELPMETVVAFSPMCDISVLGIYKHFVIGKMALRNTIKDWSARVVSSHDEQRVISLCFFKSVLNPNSRPRLVWTIMGLVALLYDIVTIPMGAFNIVEAVPALAVVDVFFLIFWTLDIIMSFRTGYYADGAVELRPVRVAANYLKTWFLFDVSVVLVGWICELSAVFTVAGSKTNSFLRIARFIRVLRLLRLVRIAKLKQLFEQIEDRINSNIMHPVLAVIKLITGFGMVVHLTACSWYAIGTSSDNGWPTYAGGTHSSISTGIMFWYSASLRWTLAQVNGRTDLDERRNMREMAFTCAVAGGLAIILMAVFISGITAAMMELSAIAEDSKKKIRRVNEFLKNNKISSGLTALIRHHSLDAKSLEETEEDQSEILSYLPKSLQGDVLYEIRATLLLGHPLFAGINSDSKKVVWQLCNEAMVPVIASKGDVLFDLNESCVRMLIVVKGMLEYDMPEDGEIDLSSHDQPAVGHDEVNVKGKSISEGHWISEAALWIEWHNCGKLDTIMASYLMAINAQAFGDAVKQHLGAHARTIAYARAFVAAMREQEDMSDVMDLEVVFH